MGQTTRAGDAGGVSGGLAGLHPRAQSVSGSTRSRNLTSGNYAPLQTPPQSGKQDTKKFLSVLAGEVGVREVPPGSNDGPRVREYLASCGITQPAPWCAAFLHWSLATASGVSGGGAWSPAWFPASRRVAAADVQRGDIGGIYFLNLKRVGHVVAAVSVSGREVETIEGNTNAAGSREGDRVARKIRDREQLVWSRWL